LGKLGPGREFLSLSQAVDEYEQRRRMAVDAAAHARHSGLSDMADPDWWWHPSWFPVVTAGGPTFACECAIAEGQPCPILVVNWHEAAEWHLPEGSPIKARSFGEMVQLWLKAFDCGAWGFDDSEERWLYDYTLLDPADELTRLV
jgi:hypothetical protein